MNIIRDPHFTGFDENFLLEVPFLTRGRHLEFRALRLKRTGKRGEPIVALPFGYTYSLHLIDSSNSLLVKNLNDLNGFVAINIPKSALALVRLFTSPRTAAALSPQIPLPKKEIIHSVAEIIPLSQLRKELVYGDIKMLNYLQKMQRTIPGYSGIVEDKQLSSALPPATVFLMSGSFRVRRSLMLDWWNARRRRNEVRLVIVDEIVSTSGQYRVDKMSYLDSKLNDQLVEKLDLRFPRGM